MEDVRVSQQRLTEEILQLLPEDGTPVLNRVMRTMLSRSLQTTITPEQYFNARDDLLKQGKIGRLRGQGGQVFLAQDAPQPSPGIEQPNESWAEAQLMEPLRLFLEGPFQSGLDLSADALCIVQVSIGSED